MSIEADLAAAGAVANLGPALKTAALYVGVYTLGLLILAFIVVRARGRIRSRPGERSQEGLRNAIRAHGNATEYAPMAGVGIVALALLGLPVWSLHVVGGIFLLGRVLHAPAMLRDSGGHSLERVLGTALSWLAFLLMGGALIFHALH